MKKETELLQIPKDLNTNTIIFSSAGSAMTFSFIAKMMAMQIQTQLIIEDLKRKYKKPVKIVKDDKILGEVWI
jgi:hypothetical protein